MPFDRVVALVMAAGYSTRFGSSDKRRISLPGGESLLMASVARVREVFPCWRLVLREEDDPQDFGLPANTPVIRAPNAAGGLGCSLADAFHAISSSPALCDLVAAAVFLGDMPCIQRGTVEALVASADKAHILRPVYAGRVGHPVIFGRKFWHELTELAGDKGAQQVIRKNASHCLEIPVTDAAVTLDVDTLADVAKLPQGVPANWQVS